MIYVDLVMDNGELVRIECPDKHEDELHETLENAMKTRGWWAPGIFDRCKAEYLGHRMDRINMARVVGRM